MSFIGVVVWGELKAVSRLILQVNPPSSQLRQIGTHHWQQQHDILLPLNTHIFRNMNFLTPIVKVKIKFCETYTGIVPHSNIALICIKENLQYKLLISSPPI